MVKVTKTKLQVTPRCIQNFPLKELKTNFLGHVENWLLLGAEDTGHVTIEQRLINLLLSLYYSLFYRFVPHCFTSTEPSTPSKSHNKLGISELKYEINWSSSIPEAQNPLHQEDPRQSLLPHQPVHWELARLDEKQCSLLLRRLLLWNEIESHQLRSVMGFCQRYYGRPSASRKIRPNVLKFLIYTICLNLFHLQPLWFILVFVTSSFVFFPRKLKECPFL